MKANRSPFRPFFLAGAVAWALTMGANLHGQVVLPIYTEGLVASFKDWSWAACNLANGAPVHSGRNSISVSASPWQALYLHCDPLDTLFFSSLSFWIHGGSIGGQRVQIQAILGGTEQTACALPALAANTWSQFVIPLDALGAAHKTNFTGYWIQLTDGGASHTFYVDDIQLNAQPAPAVVHIGVDASRIVRTVDSRLFGANTAIWDTHLNTATTVSLLRDLDAQVLRFPGGSLSDEYHWVANTIGTNTWTWETTFDDFIAVATQLQAQVVLTVNYGTGTPAEAAAWVRYANVAKNCGFQYWEIGNENYGPVLE